MDEPSNLYSNPQHNPLASTIDTQQKEGAWYVPPASTGNSAPRTDPINPFQGGGRTPASEALPFFARSAGGDFFLNLIVVGVLWEVWICLYRISAFAAAEALIWSMPFLRGVLPASQLIGPGLYAIVGGFAIAAIVLWTASRFEHVLARHLWYRIPRHIVRLALLGFAATIAIQKYEGMAYDPRPAALGFVLRSPVNLVIIGLTIIASHFILWNWTWARNFWHARLEGAGLRKRAS